MWLVHPLCDPVVPLLVGLVVHVLSHEFLDDVCDSRQFINVHGELDGGIADVHL